MLPSKTVFVVGAGASAEVGLPVGSGLKQTIAEKLDIRFEMGYQQVRGDSALVNVIRRAHPDRVNEYLDAGHRIRGGLSLSPSIDDFIDVHRHDLLVGEFGKVAIARSILEAERASKLYFERKHADDTIDFGALSGAWLPPFYQLLTQQIPKSELATLFSNVTIVTFNYDRCIEHFFVHAIASHYGLKAEESSELVHKFLVILRPYGSVAPYFGNSALPFGSERLPTLDEIKKTLRTYTEQIEEKERLTAIHRAVSDAAVIVFLGNAFHPNNVSLLSPDLLSAVPRKRIYATRLGVSDQDLPFVEKRLRKLGGALQTNSHCEFFFTYLQERCADLFARYHMSLRQ
jgi:hypothetical protein